MDSCTETLRSTHFVALERKDVVGGANRTFASDRSGGRYF
jgi:hypothetical protein